MVSQIFILALGTAKKEVFAVKIQMDPVSFREIGFAKRILYHDVINLCRGLT